MLSKRGVAICDSDILAHEAIKKGTEGYKAIVREFGTVVLGADSEIDRRTLGDVVFGDKEKLKLLNSIIHPVVYAGWTRWLDNRRNEGCLAAVMVPLLFEAGFDNGWDAIICVASRRDVQVGRLMGRGFSEKESLTRINSQMSIDEKCVRSDYVFINNFDLRLLGLQVTRTMNILLGEKIC